MYLTNFAIINKKTVHNVATFGKMFYLCSVSRKRLATSRRAIKLTLFVRKIKLKIWPTLCRRHHRDQGRSDHPSHGMGNVRAMTMHKGEVILCSDQGIYASNSFGHSWFKRGSERNFVDIQDMGNELIATVSDGHIYASSSGGFSWFKRRWYAGIIEFLPLHNYIYFKWWLICLLNI